MRLRVPVAVLGAYALYHLLAADPEPLEPDPSAEAPAAALSAAPIAADEPDLLERLVSWWPGYEPPPAPPRDPVVHCVDRREEEDGYVRASECEDGGGRADEPPWARLD